MKTFKNLKMEQVALANFAYGKYSLKYTLDSLQRLGAKAIEFYTADPHFCLDDATPAAMRSVKKMLDERGLHVVNVCPENCTYPMNLASKNPLARKRTFDLYVRAIQTASEWECPHCLCFPGFATFDGSQEEAWVYGIDAMTALSDIASAYGVKIILETASAASTVITSIDKTVQMIEQIASPALSGMIDLMCIEIVGETIENAVHKLGIDRVNHIHFSNAVQIAPGQWEHRIPEEGILPMEHMLEVLDEAGYSKHFGCEVFNPYKREPEKAMQSYLDWCRARFAE